MSEETGEPDETDDAAQIRALITKWADAVHRGDLDGVVADHAEDLVMYDVPPPHHGIHGLAAYRAAWPPFFAWQAQGACFDIEPSTSPRAPTSPGPTRCCAARPPRNSPNTPPCGCG